jgi:signal transduction histidine kinase
MLRIVCIDDESDDVELVRVALERAELPARVERIDDEAGLLRCLESPPDLLLCDYSMPGFSAERALAIVAIHRHRVPLVVVTRSIGEDAVVQLFRAGAKDYVGKDKLALLPAVIRRVLRERSLELERQRTAEALADANARLRLLSSHLVDAQERERTLVARELHDSLGQVLTSVVIHLHASARSEAPADVDRYRQGALELVQQAIRQVKSMSFNLRPAQLELLGFPAAAQATLERTLEASDVKGSLRMRGIDPRRTAPAQTVALRVLQEALTNMLRHAGARSVVVRLRFVDADRFVLTVGDDGCGFDVAATLAGGLSEGNLGLRGMLERAELMGGRLRFRSRRGRGTTVRLTL